MDENPYESPRSSRHRKHGDWSMELTITEVVVIILTIIGLALLLIPAVSNILIESR